MEISTIMKNARTDAHLSQEQAAEALGVSRQTISNWENGKTYPDIVSVIKMSDLYSVSLDRLLKGETVMNQNYQNYLKESTDVVASNDKKSKLLLLVTTLIVWALAVFAFLLSRSDADINGYSSMVMSVVFFVTLFAAAFVMGQRDYFGKAKWIFVPVAGILAALTGGVTVMNAVDAFYRSVSWPDMTKLVIGLILSLAGLLIGSLIRRNACKKA